MSMDLSPEALPSQPGPTPVPGRPATPRAAGPALPAAFDTGPPIRRGLGWIAGLVAALGLWMMFAALDSAVIAQGQLEAERGPYVVQHPDGGVVEQIFVTNGDHVLAGAPLMRLDGTRQRAELGLVEHQYLEILARRGRLEAERDDAWEIVFPPGIAGREASDPEIRQRMGEQRRIFEARLQGHLAQRSQLERRADQLRAEMAGLNTGAGALARQSALITRELANQRALFDRGLAQAARVLALEREAARLEGAAGSAQAELAKAQGQLAEIALERERLDSDRREQAMADLRDDDPRESELAERRRALRLEIARLDIRTHVAGVVDGLALNRDAVLRPAQPLLNVVPQDQPLQVIARIGGRAATQVQPGQRATLRLEGDDPNLPPRQGRVVQILPNPTRAEDGRPEYFRAEIALEPPPPGTAAQSQPLLPGLPVEVQIGIGEQSALRLLSAPLARYLQRAFRAG